MLQDNVPPNCNETLSPCQDRLVSELRYAGATNLAEANAGLRKFCAGYNHRFALPATGAAGDFRRLPRRFDLDRCLSLPYQRAVGPDHTVTLGAHAITLPPLPGLAVMPENRSKLSHQLGSTLRTFRATLYCEPCPCRSKNTPNSARHRSPRHRNEKTRCPASTTSPAAPLWRPLPKRRRG